MRAPAARDLVGLVKAPGRQFFQRSAQSARRRFGQRRPSSPRRRCRCCRRRFACGLRSRSTCQRARCSSCTCTPPCCTISTWTNNSSIGAWCRTSTWQSRSCATSCGSPPWGSCTTRRRICSEATRCMCGATIFSPPTCCGVQRLCRLSWRRAPRARARAARSAWASRTSTRAAGLQQSRRGRRRLAERRRCFFQSCILASAAGRAHVSRRLAGCCSRAATSSSRCARRLEPGTSERAHTC